MADGDITSKGEAASLAGVKIMCKCLCVPDPDIKGPHHGLHCPKYRYSVTEKDNLILRDRYREG